jgi:hypothetical protein
MYGYLPDNSSLGKGNSIVRDKPNSIVLGEAGAHAAWLADLMTRHKAKRNFMKLLREQGYGTPASSAQQ